MKLLLCFPSGSRQRPAVNVVVLSQPEIPHLLSILQRCVVVNWPTFLQHEKPQAKVKLYHPFLFSSIFHTANQLGISITV